MRSITRVPPTLLWQRIKAAYGFSNRERALQPLPLRGSHPIRRPLAAQARFIAAVTNPDFVAVAIFSMIGLLLTVNFILRVASAGSM
jgi:hypothetical protein